VSRELARQAPTQPPRLRLTRPEVPEIDLQETVAVYLRLMLLPPACWTAFPAGHVQLEPAQAARLYRCGLARGWPDMLILHNGITHGLELKRRGGELSKSRYVRNRRTGALRWVEGQEDVLPRLLDAGARVAVCDSMDSVIAALRAWELPLRRSA
jgi:hypothetical protein